HFLFAYYGASYGQLSKSKEYDVTKRESLNLPEYLFDAQFEAWQYGHVIRDVYKNNKYSLGYNDIDFSMSNFEIEDKTMQQEITEYLREIIKSTLKISDFGLVERSHEDEEWKNKITQQEIMNNDLIIKEYIGLVNA
ncbi:type II toxin-antitoxin system antitoxin SocA domain-containing protein, partial [Staphylococcus haemolyticus]|uniref:type II toxin-antitoxin system antitoxin SocA domain-containing protein n=1 Tax=Staphylococcus haemolyticus TaxID=1283 RepID=UPI0015D91B87